MSATRYLLTGATGFLGREVLVRLLRQGSPVLALTRGRGDTPEQSRDRVVKVARDTDSEASLDSLFVAQGDVTEPGLGLDAAAHDWLRQGPVQVVHGAAEVRFDLPYPAMRAQNVDGTQRVLEVALRLAEAGHLARFDHVSTCYVAGDRQDLAREDERDVGQRPRNDYERTKLEAELLVETYRQRGLPVTVHRPSIIVGDSRNGRASSFKVLYWPMKVYARGRFRTVFGRPDCPVDVVPVDFVADAMLTLMNSVAATGRTFHLAAGPQRQATIAQLVAIAERVFGGKRVRYLDPDFYLKWLRPIVRPILRILRPDVAERGGVYLPYLRANPSFDISSAKWLLGPIQPPPVSGYFETIMVYARDTDFGRKKLLSAPLNPPP